jgi:ABC-2 type transport system ATP-binding protein
MSERRPSPIMRAGDPRPLEELVAGARSAPTGAAILIEGLTKTYADGTSAVRGITTTIEAGSSYGILGPNGAGKSTTIGMLGTLLRPTGGRAEVAGFDVVREPTKVRRRIGFAMQTAGLDGFATAFELLVLQGRLQGLSGKVAAKRAELLLELVGLLEDRDSRLGTFSGGMARRVDLAASLMHLPPVLFLDEPTEGLDPRARAAIWTLLDALRARLATTLVLSTHYMEEAARLCDRIGIVSGGLLLAEGTPAQLIAATGAADLEGVYLTLTGGRNGAAEPPALLAEPEAVAA